MAKKSYSTGPNRQQRADLRAGTVRQEEFVSELLPFLRRFLARRILPEEELDDAIQESLLALLQALPRFRGEATRSTFALAIAWRSMLASRRALARHRKVAEQMTDPEQVLVENLGPLNDPYEACMFRTGKDKILSHLESLPEDQAYAFVLRHLEGCSVSEVARLTGAPVPTVKSRLRAARQRLLAMIRADASLTEFFELDGAQSWHAAAGKN